MTTPLKKVPIHLQSSANRLLIKHGKVVNASGIVDQDVYVEEGVIKQLGRNLIVPGGTRVIDARGQYVIPGGIDPHTHFQFEFMGSVSCDDFYQGTKAAIAGGTTTIIDFVMPRANESIPEAYHRYRMNADPKVCCDYGLHIGLPRWGADIKEQMKHLTSKYGVNSYKFFMAYDFALKDAEIYQAMETCKEIGALPMVHAENGELIKENAKRLLAQGITGPEGHELSRNEDVEAEAVNRVCVIAKQLSSPLYIVHMMCPDAVEILVRARNSNPSRLIGETLAAAVGADGRQCLHADFNHAAAHILSPPLRSKPGTRTHLLRALHLDDLQVTGSDNCTFTSEQKAIGKNDFTKIPNGVNGVEDRLSVIYEKGVVAGVMDMPRFVAVTSTNAAKAFNLYPQKGCIKIGSDADIVIWNPNKSRTISARTHHQACDYNIFEGMTISGVPDIVIVKGRVCVDEGELKVVQGFGKYLTCEPFAPFVYGDAGQIQEFLTKKFSSMENGVEELTVDDHKEGPVEERFNMPTFPSSVVSTPSHRGHRNEGQRDLQSTTFSVSGDDDDDRRPSTRVRYPPGGKSSGGFW